MLSVSTSSFLLSLQVSHVFFSISFQVVLGGDFNLAVCTQPSTWRDHYRRYVPPDKPESINFRVLTCSEPTTYNEKKIAAIDAILLFQNANLSHAAALQRPAPHFLPAECVPADTPDRLNVIKYQVSDHLFPSFQTEWPLVSDNQPNSSASTSASSPSSSQEQS